MDRPLPPDTRLFQRYGFAPFSTCIVLRGFCVFGENLAKNKVPVYSVHGNILRYVTVSQAEEMIGKSAKRVSRLKAPLKIQLTQLERVDGSSPCSISYQEALANVGISDKRGEHNFVSRSRMQMVQAKVAEFARPSWQDRVVTA